MSLCDEGLCFLLFLTSYRSESQKVQKLEKVLRRAKKRLESQTTLPNQKHSAEGAKNLPTRGIPGRFLSLVLIPPNTA